MIKTNAAIQIDNLCKNFGNYRAVDNLSLDIAKGEIFGFLGLNGAGKSTTIKMMLSLLKPTSGNIYMLDSKVDSGNHKLWEKVGYLETATSYPGLTVMENLDIARRMQGITDRSSIDRVVAKLGLTPHKDKKAKNLSLGNKQRLGLAKSMIHSPEILILDEPINGLDPAGVAEIRDMLSDLSGNFGVTVFISSHLLEEISKIAQRIGVIHEGKLLQVIKMEQLEQSLEKNVVLSGKDVDAIIRLLKERKYDFTETVATENLEDYFLRTINITRGRINEYFVAYLL